MEQQTFDLPGCLASVRANDQDAAAALVEHLYPLVIKIVRGHLPRRLQEEDLAQEIFMKVFANLDRYHNTAPFEHWVSRIAMNACLNQLRAEKVRKELRRADLSESEVAVIDALPGAADHSHPIDAIASEEVVEKLLEILPPKDRLIIRLLELEDLSVEEIRKRTGWTSPMIRIRAFRARQKLRQRLMALQSSGRDL